jgi:hypothetical protein
MKNKGIDGRKAEPIWRRQAMSPVGYIARFAVKPLQLEIISKKKKSWVREQTGKYQKQHISFFKVSFSLYNQVPGDEPAMNQSRRSLEPMRERSQLRILGLLDDLGISMTLWTEDAFPHRDFGHKMAKRN